MSKAIKGHVHALLAAGLTGERSRWVPAYPACTVGGVSGGASASAVAAAAVTAAAETASNGSGGAAGPTSVAASGVAGAGTVGAGAIGEVAGGEGGVGECVAGMKRQLAERDLGSAIKQSLPAQWLRPSTQQVRGRGRARERDQTKPVRTLATALHAAGG